MICRSCLFERGSWRGADRRPEELGAVADSSVKGTCEETERARRGADSSVRELCGETGRARRCGSVGMERDECCGSGIACNGEGDV